MKDSLLHSSGTQAAVAVKYNEWMNGVVRPGPPASNTLHTAQWPPVGMCTRRRSGPLTCPCSVRCHARHAHALLSPARSAHRSRQQLRTRSCKECCPPPLAPRNPKTLSPPPLAPVGPWPANFWPLALSPALHQTSCCLSCGCLAVSRCRPTPSHYALIAAQPGALSRVVVSGLPAHPAVAGQALGLPTLTLQVQGLQAHSTQRAALKPLWTQSSGWSMGSRRPKAATLRAPVRLMRRR